MRHTLRRPAVLAVHRRYLIVKHCLVSAAINVVINGTIPLVLYRHGARVPLLAFVGIATDTLSTTFMLPASTCVVVTFLVRRDIALGRVPPLDWTRATHPRLLALGALSVLGRSLVLGAVCALILTSAVFAAFELAHCTSLALWPFVLYKAALGGALAALVTPLIAVWALSGPSYATREKSSAQFVPP